MAVWLPLAKPVPAGAANNREKEVGAAVEAAQGTCATTRSAQRPRHEPARLRAFATQLQSPVTKGKLDPCGGDAMLRVEG